MSENSLPLTPLDCSNQWAGLVEIHNHAKSIFLLAEEFDPEFLDFIQPIIEQRNAFEHIIRAKAAEISVNTEGDAKSPDYIPKSFGKALGHEYRAFFDAADWFSVCIRDRIQKTLSRYSHDCISEVLPDYYPKLRPMVDKICKEIAFIRGDKDISKGPELLDEVRKYRVSIDELLNIYSRIEDCIPALVDWNKRNLRSALRTWLFGAVFGGVIVAVLAALLLRALDLQSP